MRFAVHELPRAKADKRAIFEWLFERSPQGGKTWLDAYDAALVRLETQAEVFTEAFENNDCPDTDVKQAFFKTRRGRIYRLLYFIDGCDVYVLRVRGPGQAPVNPDDLK
jgi:hypothetical protein